MYWLIHQTTQFLLTLTQSVLRVTRGELIWRRSVYLSVPQAYILLKAEIMRDTSMQDAVWYNRLLSRCRPEWGNACKAGYLSFASLLLIPSIRKDDARSWVCSSWARHRETLSQSHRGKNTHILTLLQDIVFSVAPIDCTVAPQSIYVINQIIRQTVVVSGRLSRRQTLFRYMWFYIYQQRRATLFMFTCCFGVTLACSSA